jgi:predicted PilT family ATPase
MDMRGHDQAPQLDSLGEKVKSRVEGILVATARLELVGDGQSTAAAALATWPPCPSREPASESGGE